MESPKQQTNRNGYYWSSSPSEKVTNNSNDYVVAYGLRFVTILVGGNYMLEVGNNVNVTGVTNPTRDVGCVAGTRPDGTPWFQ